MKKFTKPISVFLLLIFLNELVFPTVAYALTGGPSQPEVESFEPVGTTEMVDLFTGDYNYNIPLLDIDGYPVNIAYHSGITTDQEASWVGLGWNLNPGVVNRNMRGVPDDFDGDKITKETHLNPDWTIGTSFGVAFEFYGWSKKKSVASSTDKKPFDLSLNFGVNYNNYKGIGFDFGVSPAYNASNKFKNKYTLGMSMNNSSRGDASISPNVGFDFTKENENKHTKGMKTGGGFEINSQQGLKNLNINASYNYVKNKLVTTIDKNAKNAKKAKTENKEIQKTLPANTSANSFASPTYSPNIQNPQTNYSLGLNFKLGFELGGSFPDFNFSGYYTRQSFGSSGTGISSRKSYGTLNSQNAANDYEALLDFNREKDGIFSSENPVLGIPQMTQDLYSISGQGVSGMFRAYRQDMGTFRDHESSADGNHNVNLGGDLGFGGPPPAIKGGFNATYNYNYARSGAWKNNKHEDIYSNLGFRHFGSGFEITPLAEPSYFKVIGEKNIVDADFAPYKNLNNPINVRVKKISGLSRALGQTVTFNDGNVLSYDPLGTVVRTKRDKRNIYIRALKAGEEIFCLTDSIEFKTWVTEGAIKSVYPVRLSRSAEFRKSHHTSEITVCKPDGNKYVYGIAAYNILQQDYSFTNVGAEKDCENGQVAYDTDHFFSHKDRAFKGIDEYFEKTEIPPYAHSYLLTSVLSSDYIDADENGPTKNDNGNYTKIKYQKVPYDYNWRVPFKGGKANLNEGLKSDNYDDNANFVYGKKEIWHVYSIEGKNHIAYFYLSKREDAMGVKGVHGGIDTTQGSYKLDSISLYTNTDGTDRDLIKTVYFEYDYLLCPNVENNSGKTTVIGNGNKGKLTLRKIFYRYGNSNKGQYNSYVFDYSTFNPSYNLKAYDCWGSYKAPYQILNEGYDTSGCNSPNVLYSKDFPYVIQNKTIADLYASAWNLTQITLPSGGKIKIDYESDDYAYVQEINAMQMYRLIGFANTSDGMIGNNLYENEDTINNYIFFEIPETVPDLDYFKTVGLGGLKDLYFNILININKGNPDPKYEYVRGFIERPDDAGFRTIGGKRVGYVRIATTEISKRNNAQCNPISKSAWQFVRLHVPYLINPGSDMMRSGASTIKELGRTLIGFFPKMLDMINGVYSKMFADRYGKQIIPGKSWIRLNNLTGFKYGGGGRVKKLTMNDNWLDMEGSQPSRDYGQEFDYTTTLNNSVEGSPVISSGVASYEPISGGDENPYKTPVYYDRKQKWVPDESYFSEKPFGEYYYPSPSVGYSRVSVKTIAPTGGKSINRNGTGKVVHEFYTARDFPTISTPSDMQMDEWKPSFIFSLFKIRQEKALTMCQSFNIELNDMHGKQKATWNFSQGQVNSYNNAKALSGVTYEYFESSEGGKRRLSNELSVITPKNEIYKAVVGVDAEAFADSRQFENTSFSGGIALNIDYTAPFLLVPTGYPDVSYEYNNFQSGVVNKIINRYGILKATTAFEEGASLRTENFLFDSETGEVLLTKTQNEFEDYIYNATYPAHWAYDRMGQTSKNEGAFFTKVIPDGVSFKVKVGGTNYAPEKYFVSGDLVKLINTTDNITNKLWVHYSDNNHYVFIKSDGSLFPLDDTKNYQAQIIISGRKNMQTLPVCKISSLKNPVEGTSIVHNSGTKIIQCSVNEYTDRGHVPLCFNTNFYNRTPLKESIDMFNYLVKCGSIRLGPLYDDFSNNRESSIYPPTLIYIDSAAGVNFRQFDAFGYTTYKRDSFPVIYSGDSTFLKSKLKIYSDSCAITNPWYSENTMAIIKNNSTYINKWILYITFSIYGNHCSGLSEYDASVANNQMFALIYIADSNKVKEILTKEIDNLVFNTHNNIVYDGKGILTFTDDSSIVVGCSIASQLHFNKFGPNMIVINPYLKGVRNSWRPLKDWTYLEKRTHDLSISTANIRRDGYLTSFNSFWEPYGDNWRKKPTLDSKWQFINENTLYLKNGNAVESRNPLNQYSSMIYDLNSTLPVAVASNAKYHNIMNDNFELVNATTGDYPECNTTMHHYFGSVSSLNYLSAEQSHSGYTSAKIDKKASLGIGINSKLNVRKFGETELDLEIFQASWNDLIDQFRPDSGKYVVSAWVKAGLAPSTNHAYIKITISGNNINEDTVRVKTKGPVIDGWQRMEQVFYVDKNASDFKLELMADTLNDASYFDDLRIFPYNGNMKTYVYNLHNMRVMAQLDENNYATFYEYDKEGQLIRVKQETEKGIVTLKENRSSLRKISN